MASPIAHSLIGLAFGLIRFLPRYRCWNELAGQLRALWRPLLFCILLANAPDLDYFFGIFRGNVNYYHQTVTHTLIWVGVTALAIWIYGRLRERRTVCWPPSYAKGPRDLPQGGIASLASEGSAILKMSFGLPWGASLGLLLALMGSHLLADWLTVDCSAPIGVMLAWPFSDQLYHAAFAFFPPPAKETWADLWSLQNLHLVLVETVITLPLVIVVLWFKRCRTGGANPEQPERLASNAGCDKIRIT